MELASPGEFSKRIKFADQSSLSPIDSDAALEPKVAKLLAGMVLGCDTVGSCTSGLHVCRVLLLCAILLLVQRASPSCTHVPILRI